MSNILKSSKTILFVFALLFISSEAMAINGKIAGRVIDKDTGDPLPGVNVFLEGTTMGAATDLDGNYVVLNVPPGNYTLKVSFMGYATTRVKNLRVSIDQTTRQDFQLSLEILEGEEVVVVAERPMVQKDLTASQKITTSEEIVAMPVEDFIGVLTTQAGVNTGPGGELHIRGGRSTEVGFYVDGVPVTNPFFTNSLATNVSNKALEELKVVSGAFNAEYGNAMSGIVNINIKEGGPNYTGSFSAYSGDYISNAEDIFLGIKNVDALANQVFEATLRGPVPFTNSKITFNISGRFQDNEGYLFGRREHLPSDSANFRIANDWYVEMNGDSAIVPMNNRKNGNFLTKLTYKITPSLKLSTQLLYDRSRYRSYVHAYKFNPDGIYNYQNDNYNYSMKLTQVFKKSFYEANIFYSTTDYKRFVFEDSTDSRYVPTTRILGTPSSASFAFGGTQMGHSYRQSNSLGGKIDLTSQINSRHEIKLGLSARIDNLNERNFTVLYDNQRYRKPTVKAENESPSHIYYDKTANNFSTYIQDKIEYDNMIINAGLRYDYFDPNSNYIADLINPDQNESSRLKAAVKNMISPRLGIAFPITDRGILHFSYGHFYQMPPLRRLYLENVFGAGLAPSLGYSNLKPEKTVIYEFGFQQQFTDVLAIEVSMFAKDIRDLMARQSIRYESDRFGPSSYSVYLNKDYGDIKGITVNLSKRYDPVTKLSAWIDYTFQTASGNSVKSGAFFFSAISGIEEEKLIVPLSWDQRHILNATVTLSEPGSWGVSFIGKIGSGWPYTPNIPNANYVPFPNSQRKPWQKNLDLHAYKNIKINRYTVVLFAKAYNLFDTRNERFVFDDTGRAGYTYVNQSAQETQGLKAHYNEPGIHTWSEYQTRPNYYSAPRLIQLGFSLEF